MYNNKMMENEEKIYRCDLCDEIFHNRIVNSEKFLKLKTKICWDCKEENKCLQCGINFANPKYGDICYKCKFPNNCRTCLKSCSEKFKQCYTCSMKNSRSNILSGCLF